MRLTYFGRYFFIILGIIVMFTISDMWVTYQSILEVRTTNASVELCKNVQLELQKTYSAFLLVAANQRSYILTQNEMSLQTYTMSLSVLAVHLTALKQLVVDIPTQKELVKSLENYMTIRLNNFAQGVKISASEGFIPAQEYEKSTIQEENATTVNAIITAIENTSVNQLVLREKSKRISYIKLYITVAIGGLLSLACTLLIAYLVARELQRRNASERNKDDFISIVSHELKTPITSMSVFSQLIEREIHEKIKNKKITSYIHKIQDQLGKQKTLIDDLSDISKLRMGEFNFSRENLDIMKLVKDTAVVVQTTTKTHKILVKGKIKKLVYADKERVNQVLINFLSNAIKYSPESNKVTIVLHSGRFYAKVSVIDEGIGIPKDHQTLIFERFYRISDNKKQYEGLGLGLYISSEIVHKLGGKVYVSSKQHKGSTFSFTIPYAKKSS